MQFYKSSIITMSILDAILCNEVVNTNPAHSSSVVFSGYSGFLHQ